MTDPVHVLAGDGVTTITLNRPARLSAIDASMHRELEDAFNAFANDPHQRVCVVTGTGAAFCAGTDLKDAHDRDFQPVDYPAHGYAGIVERFDLEKPVIAAVNGLALGGGFELALACDIILADANASFGLPEPRIGAVPLAGGIHRLARQIGQKQAMGMLLTSRRVSAAEGLRMGFVNAVSEAGTLAALVDEWVADILAGAPLALRAIKQAVQRGLEEPSLAAVMRAQADYSAWTRWADSDEAKEGISSFVEKRPPVWPEG